MKKLLSLTLALVLALSLAGVAQAQAAYTPGAYTATAKGFGGDVAVTITVDEQGITQCQVVGDGETPAIGGVAIASLPAQIVAAGGTNVDATSGATVTSSAILTALGEALAQASGTQLTVNMAPGTYTASAYGFQAIAPIAVSVTVDEDSIEHIEFDGSLESVAMIRSVNTYLLPRIMQYQSVGVDAVCGATTTSKAVLTAASQCLQQALVAGGSDPAAISAFMTPEPRVQAEETIDVDVLVVGMGAAGVAACMSAAEAQAAAGRPVSGWPSTRRAAWAAPAPLPANPWR